MSKTDQPAGVFVDRGVRPILEPPFLLHCGALFGGERDEWVVEANSGRAVDELADQHPGREACRVGAARRHPGSAR